MLSSQGSKKLNKKEQNTRPSHQSQMSSQQSQSRTFSQQNCSVQSFNNLVTDDGEIKFDNGWVYNGQHYSNQFHGWGRLIDPQNNQVYKGNFSNGYFHGYGKIIFNPMFEYLIDPQALRKWLPKFTLKKQSLNSSLNQIQVRNPFSKANKQIYTFQKYSSKRIRDNQSQRQSNDYEVSQIQWMKYKGQFNEGNITGFGTLKIKIITQISQVSIQTQRDQQILQIVGKFLQGKIVTGILKK